MKNISLEINGVLFDKLSIAETYHDMLHGLDAKRSLNDNEGMIYIFEKDRTSGFVNENPYIDIDMIMIDAQKQITAIHSMKKAVFSEGESEKEHLEKRINYTSPVPYRYVFELKAGTIQKLGIKIGDILDIDYQKLLPFKNAENICYAFQLKKVSVPDNWIQPLLQRMKNIADHPDALQKLNLEFVGGILDQNVLMDANWIKLDGIDTPETYNMWFQKNIHIAGQLIGVRLVLSIKGHFRYLYTQLLAEDGSYLPEKNFEKMDIVAEQLRTDFNMAQTVPPFDSIATELENIVLDLTNPSIKDEWTDDQKKFYLWSKDFYRSMNITKFYGYRFLNGMLRFENFCNYDFIFADPLWAASDLNHHWAMAKLIIMALKNCADSTNPELWNSIGYALDRLNEKEAALYCFAKAWNYNSISLYANNLWLMGNCIIPKLLKEQNWDSLYPIASIMLSAISNKATVKQQLEIMCIVGLIYENKDDFKEADQYYGYAYDIYKENRKEDNSLFSLWYKFPLLYQALMRSKMEDTKQRRIYAEAQLKTFPATPQEAGFNGRLAVEYTEGGSHGDHWECVIEEEQLKKSGQFFKTMIENGIRDTAGAEIPICERGIGQFIQGTGFRYSSNTDKDSPVESYFILGKTANHEPFTLVTGFPVFKKGHGCSIIRTVKSANIWGNALEAVIDFDLHKNHNSLSFFMPNYYTEFDRLKPDTVYRIELGAFAYCVNLFEEREIKIDKGFMLEEEKLRLRKEGKEDNIESVSIHLDNDLCNISRSFFSNAIDDISVTAPIEKIEEFSFMGNDCLVLWLKFDERGANINLPVFLRKSKLDNSICLKVGDVVECACWLQGWIHESHELNNVPDIPSIEDCDSEEDKFDFSRALLSGVRGTDYNLEPLATLALERIKAENIYHNLETLPGDADISCYIDGEVKFIKIMTGYFENEEEYKQAWKKFCDWIPCRPDGAIVHLLSVAGIKLHNDQYKIYYNGFHALNPSAEFHMDELTLA